jgi:hypothetical protein
MIVFLRCAAVTCDLNNLPYGLSLPPNAEWIITRDCDFDPYIVRDGATCEARCSDGYVQNDRWRFMCFEESPYYSWYPIQTDMKCSGVANEEG